MRIAWYVVALLAGATAWAQAQDAHRNDKKAKAQTPYGEVTPKLWHEGKKLDPSMQKRQMTMPQMLAMGMLPSPLGESMKSKAKVEPIPTEWPDLKMGPIPTTWPKLKMLLVGGGKKEPDGKK